MISIVICVYNEEKVISKAIESVLMQNFEDYELIIVDDGSIDSTLDICKEYADIDDRIRIIYQQNRGLGYARSIGLAHARGEWITFLDADDWYEKNWIRDLLEPGIKENADIVIGNAYMCYNMKNGTIAREERKAMSKRYIFEKENELNFLVANAIAARINSNSGVDIVGQRSIGTVWDKLYRMSFIKENKINFKDTRFCEDLPFTSKCFTLANKVIYVDAIGYNYLIRENSLSDRHDYKYIEDNQETVKYYLNTLNLKSEIIRRAIAVSQIRFLKIDMERYFSYSENHGEILNELKNLLESETFLAAISLVDDRLDDMSEDEKKLVYLIKKKIMKRY